MTWDAFSQSIMLVIFASFVVERSLAVIFETRYYIRRFAETKGLKPTVAIVYAVIFVIAVDINLAKILRLREESTDFGYDWTGASWQSLENILIAVATGLLVAGGSKASLKLFKDVWNIKSTSEALRTSPTTAAPAFPADAALAAANGNGEAEQMLINLFEASGLPRVGKP